jgi:hypothetical protein
MGSVDDFASHHEYCQCQRVEYTQELKRGAISGKTNQAPHSAAAANYNGAMYLIAIGWLYVTVLMALTESSLVAGVLSFVVYGLAPTALLLWLFGRPVRRRNSTSTDDKPLAQAQDSCAEGAANEAHQEHPVQHQRKE